METALNAVYLLKKKGGRTLIVWEGGLIGQVNNLILGFIYVEPLIM